MSSPEPLCSIIGIKPQYLSNEENLILEANLFSYLCDTLKTIFATQHNHYFRLLKSSRTMENETMDSNFVRCVINDILSTNEYTLPGIAFYTQTPEEVIYEVVTGKNTSPSVMLVRRVIELHKSIRGELYREIMRKATFDCLAEDDCES